MKTQRSHFESPVRQSTLPYGKQWIDDDDIAAVVEILRSDWLTTGPKVEEFEQAFALVTGSAEAVAVSSGTAALHAAMYALGVGRGDEVIVPTMTFAASANCVVFQGATPIFIDVEADTLRLDAAQVETKITTRTKAIVAVDYAGQPCDYDGLRVIAERNNLAIVADACHALGGAYKDRPVGSLADLNTFSFHPVKPITTGEGGVITTNDSDLARRMRIFRNHGITTDHRQRETQGSWFYEMMDLGFNYRITDFQCALGQSQLSKLPAWVTRRQSIAHRYDLAFSSLPHVRALATRKEMLHAYHLYVVRLNTLELGRSRAEIFGALRREGIGVNVHYVPVHYHPFYRQRFGTKVGMCPVAEAAYEEIISLPIFPRMTDEDVEDTISAVRKVIRNALR
jgi:perosamine synthetase